MEIERRLITFQAAVISNPSNRQRLKPEFANSEPAEARWDSETGGGQGGWGGPSCQRQQPTQLAAGISSGRGPGSQIAPLVNHSQKRVFIMVGSCFGIRASLIHFTPGTRRMKAQRRGCEGVHSSMSDNHARPESNTGQAMRQLFSHTECIPTTGPRAPL